MTPGSPFVFDSFDAFVAHGLHGAASVERRSLPDRSAHMYRFRADHPLPDPSVPELALHLLIAGRIRYVADFGFGRFEGVKMPGEFDVVPPGLRGGFEGQGSFEMLTLTVPWSAVRQAAEEAGCGSITHLGPLHSGVKACPMVAELLHLLWAEAADTRHLCTQFCEVALTTLLVRLIRLAGISPEVRTPGVVRGGLAAWQIKRVREYIDADLTRDLSVAELAGLCRLSAFHFARAFRQSVGQPPHAYVTTRRLARARRLLDETTQSVTDIALAVGYAEPSHLARVFKRAYGVGPAEHRRRRRSASEV